MKLSKVANLRLQWLPWAHFVVYCHVTKGVDKWGLRGLKPPPPQMFDKTNNVY